MTSGRKAHCSIIWGCTTGLLAVCGFAAAPPAASALRIDNTERCQSWLLEQDPSSRFTIIHHHSIYDRPVAEEYEIGEDGALWLRGLESDSAAVLEYFGITAPGARHRQDIRLGSIPMRIAMGEAQRLVIAGKGYSLREFGGPGDRLVLRTEPLSANRLGAGPAPMLSHTPLPGCVPPGQRPVR